MVDELTNRLAKYQQLKQQDHLRMAGEYQHVSEWTESFPLQKKHSQTQQHIHMAYWVLLV